MWQIKRERSLWGTYRLYWRFHSYHMFFVHLVAVGVIGFLVTLKPYQGGEIGWFWPAISLAIAFVACLALFVPGEETNNDPWL